VPKVLLDKDCSLRPNSKADKKLQVSIDFRGEIAPVMI
jgi:hypothetical protein